MGRQGFREAADCFVETVRLVPGDLWDAPALGVWSVRSLVGHASRALLIVEQFAAVAPAAVDIADSADYYRRAFTGEGTNERIAERGRLTGEELGDDPAGAVAALRDRVLAAVDALPDDHPLGTLIGGIRLIDYLPGRTTELVVHTLDLGRAVGVDGPPSAAGAGRRAAPARRARAGVGARRGARAHRNGAALRNRRLLRAGRVGPPSP